MRTLLTVEERRQYRPVVVSTELPGGGRSRDGGRPTGDEWWEQPFSGQLPVSTGSQPTERLPQHHECTAAAPPHTMVIGVQMWPIYSNS